MNQTASIRLKDGRYMWTYQDDSGIFYGHTDTMEEAKKMVEDARGGGGSSVDEYFDTFMAGKKNLKPSTEIKYRQLYKTFIGPVIGGEMVCQVMPLQLEILMTDLVNSSVSPITASAVQSLLSSMFRQAAKSGRIDSNPMLCVEVPRSGKKPTRRSAFTESELDELLKRASLTDQEMIFKVAAWTGSRIGEVLGLLWEDVDFEGEVIEICHNLGCVNGHFILTSPKTEAGRRSIPVSAENMKELKKYRESEAYQKRNLAAAKEYKDYVFLGVKGKPLNASYVSAQMRKLVDEMKEEGILSSKKVYTFHSLRHTFATRCLMKGMKPKVLSTILGHSSTKITLEIYTHVEESDMRNEMERLKLL